MVRRLLSAIIVIGFVGILFAQEVAYRHITAIESSQADTIQQKTSGKTPQRRRIDFMADEVKPYNRTGDSIVYFVGNFAAHHNGTVITCDSTVRYSDSHLECFGNVLIKKGTTYIYGDRADYNGEKNEAHIFSDIIKVVDKGTTMYTYNFTFNTKTNIGTFTGGGVVIDDKNRLEADRGYYNADTKDIICVDRVEMRDEKYQMKGDSVIYNTESENAYFHENTHIWDADGNYLSGDRGEYNKAAQQYLVTRNGYLLTETQELWSDTLDYFRLEKHVILRNNLQIDETEHKNLVFGDFGEYWEESGNGFLTKDPVVINYDTEQNADSVFLRSDSIYLYTLKIGDPIPNEYASVEPVDSTAVSEGLATPKVDAEGAAKRREELQNRLNWDGPKPQEATEEQSAALAAATWQSLIAKHLLIPGFNARSRVQPLPPTRPQIRCRRS